MTDYEPASLAPVLTISVTRPMNPESNCAVSGLHTIEQTVMRGKERHLDTGGGADFVEDMRNMPFDSAFADRELAGNLLVRVAAHHHSHDVQFASRQPKGLRAPPLDIQLA